MNQTFSPARFVRLNRWFWAIKGRTYLLAALALIPIMILIPSQVLYDDDTFSLGVQRNNIAYYLFMALLVTFSIGSDVFSALFRQESAIAYLMIPASRTEKFWLGVLYSTFALVLLSVAYFSYEAFVFNIANSQLPANEPYRYMSTLIYNYSGDNADKELLLLNPCFLFISLAISLIGSFFFRRGVLVRNVGLTLLLALGMTLLYPWLIAMQSGGHRVGTALPFYPIDVYTFKDQYELFGPPAWLKYGAYGGTLLALWVIARIRFNEVER